MFWLNLATGQTYRKFNWEFAKLCAYIISKWNIKWRLVFQCVSTSCCCMQLYVDEASRSRKLSHNGFKLPAKIEMREYCEEAMWVWLFQYHKCQKILSNHKSKTSDFWRVFCMSDVENPIRTFWISQYSHC